MMLRLIAILGAAICPLPLLAVISISTAGIPSTDGTAAVPTSYNQWLATSIMSDDEETTSDLMVEALTLRMQVEVPNQNFFVGIATSAAFRPDMSNVVAVMDVTPLIDNPVLSAVTDFRLTVNETATPEPILSAGQGYWLVVGATAVDPDETPQTGLYYWSFANSGSPVEAPSGWSVPSQVAQGGSGGSGWNPVSETPYTFDLELSAVPEPSCFVLVVAAFSLFATMCMRRRVRNLV